MRRRIACLGEGSTDGLLIQFNLDADGVLDYLAVDSFTRRDHPGHLFHLLLVCEKFPKEATGYSRKTALYLSDRTCL
ncbi:hypothetical protein, partial [Escherichia coli]|uniref:hypothetical protein n=1 Tax=Escherichia coli TaxID=562 RepID=UPI003CEFC564